MGTATVIFKNRADALKALNQYNKVALDGKKLEIALVEERVVARLASGIRYGRKCGILCVWGGSVEPGVEIKLRWWRSKWLASGLRFVWEAGRCGIRCG